MGGNRKTASTKGGKYMNPTDQARKEERKKQLKKHKRQREQVREAVIKSKNPNSVLDELVKLDDLEFDAENECPYADRVMQEKRTRMKATYFKILEYYKTAGKMDTWKEYQDDYNQYERERERKQSLFQAVLKAKNWSVDQIPLPDAPLPDSGMAGIPLPMGLPPRMGSSSSRGHSGPPGPPPGPPPEKKKYKRPSQKDSSIQNTLLALAGQEAREREEENPPPPPPGIPIENRTRNPYGAQFQSRPVDPSAMQAHAMPMSSGMPHFTAQNAYMRQAAPTMIAPDISSAPTSYNAPKGATESAQKLSATHQKTLSAAPVMKRPKGHSTMFMPSALRGNKPRTSHHPPAPRPVEARPAPPVAKPAESKNQDQAYEKFMAEMAGLL
ncbi:unnamed protein product [Oikopleura dioica]|uniref:Wbp11/ELF5/Saf1 N-terminal domain-containing protein n=1 Tax=Oikopleura dioica TaxID=34765 RepID=E4X0W3_OIKDI|nr:unnamed protein product [Oikopleura dioica]